MMSTVVTMRDNKQSARKKPDSAKRTGVRTARPKGLVEPEVEPHPVTRGEAAFTRGDDLIPVPASLQTEEPPPLIRRAAVLMRMTYAQFVEKYSEDTTDGSFAARVVRSGGNPNRR